MHTTTVKVKFTDKKGLAGPKDKKYSAKKKVNQADSLDEATQEVGERGLVEAFNRDKAARATVKLRRALVEKVTGTSSGDSESVEMEDVDLDD